MISSAVYKLARWESILDRCASLSRICLVCLGVWSFFGSVLPLAEKSRQEEAVSKATIDHKAKLEVLRKVQTALAAAEKDVQTGQEGLNALAQQLTTVTRRTEEAKTFARSFAEAAIVDYKVVRTRAVDRLAQRDLRCIRQAAAGWPDSYQLSLQPWHWDACLFELADVAVAELHELDAADRESVVRSLLLAIEKSRGDFVAMLQVSRTRVAAAASVHQELQTAERPVDVRTYRKAEDQLSDAHIAAEEDLRNLLRSVLKAAVASSSPSHVTRPR
jgi:hypothetical protein